MSEKVKILVCCHKEDQFKSDDVYMPIHVGKKNSGIDLGIQGDDEGDNISDKNASYCELTGLYWAWKNLKEVDYIGLCHYRRYFNFHERGTAFCDYTIVNDDVDKLDLELPSVSKLFSKYDIVLAKRKVFPYSLHTQYCIGHFSKDINLLNEIIVKKYPQYKSSVNQIFYNKNRISCYNMFIMKWSEFDKYCNWLFSILEEAESRTDISSYDDVQKRIFGYQAERLLNLYVYHNKMKVKYYPIYWMNSMVKIASIKRRFIGYLRKTISFAFVKSYRTRC